MPFVDTRYGQLDMPDRKDDLIGTFLSRYGEWAWDEVVFVASNLAPGARILDVGAYLGTFGLGLGMRQSLASLCFVEANPEVTGHLRENVRRLKRQPSQVVAALVHAGGEPPTTGHIDRTNWGALSFAPDATGEPFTRLLEGAVTLAELREFYGPFDLIKLDVEGMERALIESDAEFFSSGLCQIWLECNESVDSLELADLLLGLGLEVYYFAFPAHNPENFLADPEPVFPAAFEAGLLAGRNLAPHLEPSLQAHGCILRPIHSREELRDALWRTPRWGLKEWDGKPASEVVALASRLLIGQEYHSFLENGPPKPELLEGERVLCDHVRRVEAQLAAHQAALADSAPGEQGTALAEMVEREGRLRASLMAREGELLERTEELAGLRALLEQGAGQMRSLEARLSEARHVAGEHRYKLSLFMPQLRVAENAAADAQARLLQATEKMGSERDGWHTAEQALREALAQKSAQVDALARQLEKQRRGPLKRTSFYRKTWRPFLKRARQKLKGSRRKALGGG